MFDMAKTEWVQILQQSLQKVVDSMPKICETVLDVRGYETKSFGRKNQVIK